MSTNRWETVFKGIVFYVVCMGAILVTAGVLNIVVETFNTCVQ